MFEIGNTLREARLRRGVELAHAEADTKIRAKYLRAMEDEQFDLLPAPSYVRGFLKSYAEYLGLDGRLVLDEYESRFGVLADVMGDDHHVRRRGQPRPGPARARQGSRSRGRRERRGSERRSEAQLLWMAIGGVTGVALLVWLGIGGEDTPTPAPVTPAPAPAPAAVRPPAPARATPAAPAAPAAPRRPQGVRVVFTGTGDTGSYLEVRGRNAQGPSVYTGILAPGTTQRFTVRRSLWVRVGNTDGVEVRVDGRPRALEGGTADFIVTRRGVRRLDDAG